MYAIIQTGGKQYRVSKGDLVEVELLDPGAEKVEFSDVYLVSNGRESVVGTPTVSGARVTGTVVGTGRSPKILVFKKKRRKHYKRTMGHRQYTTAVRIQEIDAGGAVEPLVEADATRTAPRPAAVKKKTVARKVAPKPKKKAAAKKKKAPATRKTAARKAPGRKKTARQTAGRNTAAGRKKATAKKKASLKKKAGKKTGRQ